MLKDTLRWLIGKKGAKADEDVEPKTKKQKFESPRTLAVAVKIYVPDACGKRFHYAVTGYARSTERENPNHATMP